MTSRNIKILGKGNAVCVEEDLQYAPLGDDEALIRNEASFISPGTELSRVYALKKGVQYPVYPGYASVGRVMEAGAALSGIQKGDRVLHSGAHKEWQTARMGANTLEMLVKIPEQPDSVQASLLHIGLIAMNAPYVAGIKPGDNVCVYGLGTIGLFAALLCQVAGGHVLGVDSVDNRAAHARSAGLVNAVAARGEAQIQAVQRFFGAPADITIDATGISEAVVNAVLSTGVNGQVVLLGSPRTNYSCNITPMLSHIHMNMITVSGAFNGRFPFYGKENSRESIRRNIDTVSRLMQTGVIDASRIISHVIRPEEIMTAYDGLFHRRDEYFCVAIDWRT